MNIPRGDHQMCQRGTFADPAQKRSCGAFGKPATVAALIGLIMAAGCDRKPDPQVTSLTERMAKVEKDIQQLRWASSNMNSVTTNVLALLKQHTEEEAVDIGAVRIILMEDVQRTEAMMKGLGAIWSNQVKATGRSLPASVYKQITDEAKKLWPNDFGMQEFHIREETMAWMRMHPL